LPANCEATAAKAFAPKGAPTEVIASLSARGNRSIVITSRRELSHLALGVDLHVQLDGAATHLTVLDVVLVPGGGVHQDFDALATVRAVDQTGLQHNDLTPSPRGVCSRPG